MNIYLIVWNKIKARLELAGFRLIDITQIAHNQFNAYAFQQAGYSNANEAYHKEIKSIIENELEDNMLHPTIEFDGLRMYLTLIG